MEERSAPFYDIFDDEITYRDAHQKCDEHAVSGLSSRSILNHQSKCYEYPNKSEVTGARNSNHKVIHER